MRQQTEYRTNGRHTLDEMDSSELHQEIDRTRHDMDETLDRLGDRLQPRHLLDDLLEMLRGSGATDQGRDMARRARQAGESAIDAVRRHPVPALVTAAGLAWLLVEQGRDAQEPEPMHPNPRGRELGLTAWHPEHDWSDATEPEESWTERASASLDSLSKTLSDASQSASAQIQGVAAKVLAFSGHKRRDIHSQWAALHEHSGSVVDARTGEPYDSNYGREWRNLAASDFVVEREWKDENEGWGDAARQTVEKMRKTLKSSSRSTREKFSELSRHVGDFVDSAGDVSTEFRRRTAERAQAARRQAGDQFQAMQGSVRSAGRSIARGRDSAAQSAQRGYEFTREKAAWAMEEQPLAVGIGALALGVLAGLALPSTSTEDRLMGDAADDLKGRAEDLARQGYDEGKRVVRDVADAAQEEAERQGLTPAQIAASAREAGEGVMNAVREKGTKSAANLKEGAERVAAAATDAARKDVQELKTK